METFVQRAIILITVLVASPLATAEDVSCTDIASKADSEAGMVLPRLSYKVASDGRLYFYSAPSESCRTDVFVIPKDELISYSELNGWLSVMYTHPKTGEISEGWVKSDR